jgi:GH35 family endo-1,4-beta-xylanase
MKYLSIASTIALVFASKVYADCWSERLGYPCCTSTNGIYFSDNDGDWGIENDDWCGIPKQSNNNSCWSKALGYNCCTSTSDVIFEDSDGQWGIENDDWCGIVKNNQPKVTTTTTTTTKAAQPTSNPNIPQKPAVTYLNNNKDPAEKCDISDSITGDSLYKAAPFRMGVGLYGTNKSSSPVFSKKMREIIKYQFNSVTFTNLMKAEFMLDKSASQANARNGNDMPVLKFDTIVDGLEFCKENNIKMRGHTLVWHTQAPEWFFRTGFNDNGSYVDKNKMEKRMESYIKQMLEFIQYYYPGVIDVWDVVNEAVEIANGSYDASSGWNTRTKFDNNKTNPWYATMGPDYVFKAFRFARKYADKNVKLIYNDFNTFQYPKTDNICNLVKKLKAENLIDGVGLQSYLGPSWPNRNDYKNAIQKFGALGVEVQITELTISVENGNNKFTTQANQYRDVFKIYKDLKKSGVNITSVTVFGLQDHYLFYDNDNTETRLWDGNLKKKPVYNAIMNVLKN